MVLVHLKNSEEDQFFFNTTCCTPIQELLQQVVLLYNLKNQLEALAEETQKLVVNCCEDVQDEGEGVPDIAKLSLDETRKTKVESEAIASTIKSVLSEALALLSKESIKAKTPLAPQAINTAIDNICSVVHASFPSHDPLNPNAEKVEESNISLWWASKELQPGELLSKYIGKNDKTTIVVKLTKSGSGPPVREQTFDEETQKAMYAYYYKKQEEQKKLEENSDDTYLNSSWSNPKMLKNSFTGTGNITWR